MEPPIGYGLTYRSIFPEPNVLAWSPAFGHSPPPRGSRFGSPVVLTESFGYGPKWSSRSAISNRRRRVCSDMLTIRASAGGSRGAAKFTPRQWKMRLHRVQ